MIRQILILLIAFTFSLCSFSQADNYSNSIILKIKPVYSNKCNKSKINLPIIHDLTSKEIFSSLEKKFPFHSSLSKSKRQKGEVDLSTIYKIYLNKDVNINKVLSQLNRDKHIAYAEKEVVNQLIYAPSDTLNDEQWYLSTVKAFEAWDIEKGDTNVVIAITDTGIDTSHVDLLPDFAINHDDPRNGIDDDNDGYVDNYYGWNTAINTNNVGDQNSAHGTNVSGIASAATDNITGISGCGFNSRLLTVKIDGVVNNQYGLFGAYDGIVYAADQGADIINASWGSYSYSEFGRDIINYAAINKGALIIAGAGNGPFSGPNAFIGVEDEFYPAAYDNAMAIGSTLPGDTVKESSNYGFWLDLFAPGEDMLTTGSGGQYWQNGGTSMAAPVVAGAAALVKSHFPAYNAKQIEYQLKNSADDFEAKNDPKYQGKLGSGRVNFYKALTQNNLPGIAFESIKITDNNDDIFVAGDTIRISGIFKNYLAAASNLNINVQSVGANIQALDAAFTISQINNLDSVNNYSDPFEFIIPSGLSPDEKAELLIEISGQNYYNREYLQFAVNLSFITVSDNELTITLTSEAGIGYSVEEGSRLGSGIMLNGSENSLLYEGGFALGFNNSVVLDKFRGTSGTDNDYDFVDLIKPERKFDADAEYGARFQEKSTTPRVDIVKRIFKYNSPGKDQSAIYSYNIKNISSSKLSEVYAGIFMDWDIVNYVNNKVKYDASRQMGISYSTDSNLYCAIKILNQDHTTFHYAIDNFNNGNGGVAIDTLGFSTAEKLQVLSSNRESAGDSSASGNDILDAVSLKIDTLAAGSSITASFAIIVGNSVADIESEADSLQLVYNKTIANLDIRQEPELNTGIKIYPNPVSNFLMAEFYVFKPSILDIVIHDMNGRVVYEDLNRKFNYPGRKSLQFNVQSLKTGLYFFSLKGENINIQDKFVVSP